MLRLGPCAKKMRTGVSSATSAVTPSGGSGGGGGAGDP